MKKVEKKTTKTAAPTPGYNSIIRMSFDEPKGKPVNFWSNTIDKKILPAIPSLAKDPTSTGTIKGRHANKQDALQSIETLIAEMKKEMALKTMEIDHIWIYVEKK